MKNANKAIWLLVSILLVGVIFVSGCTQEQPKLNCQGIYIEYQGNCCIDADYNNICDELEIKSATDNSISRNINCWSDLQCYGTGDPYMYRRNSLGDWRDNYAYGSSEWCSERCEISRCTTYNCFIKHCISDSNCRAGKRCVDYNCQ